MRSPSALQQRCIALALLGAALLLIWLGLIAPVENYFSSNAQARDAALTALSRDRALLREDTETRAALASVAGSTRWTRFYETQKSDQAILQMQNDLREVFKAPNNPTSMTAVPVVVEGPLTRIATKITLSLTIDQWADALARLQTHAQLLRIDSLSIQAPDFQTPDSNPILSIQAEIAGFMVTQSPRT